MPITPDFLSSEIDYLTTHKELQESIMRDIVRRLIKTDMTVTDSAKWQAEKLEQSGKMYKDVISEISRLTKQSENEIKSIFADAETEVFNYADEILIKSGYIPDEVKNISPSMTKLINASLKKTSTEAKNLTKTTAITTQSLFIQSADLAHMQVASGAFPYQQAIKNAIQFASKQGTKVIYPSGHVSSLSVAMRRAVLTGVNQTCGQLQNMRADELGIDIMEITAHAGARPGHAVWQGQLVSRSGQDGYLSLSDIGYGEVTGFMGANCRHNWNMFFEGSVRNYTDAHLEELKNETVTYDGEEIKVYEALEKQRAMERGIRSIKSELVAYDEIIKNTSDADEKLKWQTEFNNASVKLKNKEAKLRDFCNQTKLKRDTYREQVFSAKTENGIKNWGKSTSRKTSYRAQEYYDIWRKGIGADDTPKTLAKYYEMKYNDKKEYNRLQKYALSVKRGEASPLLSYKMYNAVAKRIETNLIGLKTINNIEINDYSSHFVCRVIGRSGTSKKFNRLGVSITDIENALTNGKIGKIQISISGEKSILFVNEKCCVTLNPDTNTLIQANPR